MESEKLGYVLVVVVVCILLTLQFNVYGKTKALIRKVTNLFPSLDKLRIDHVPLVDNDGDHEMVTQLLVEDNMVVKEEFKTIMDSINNYLSKNKGAASDFMLIKDIVERNCDSIEEEISTQTPIPLYIGLMGTMCGIVLGLGKIALLGNGFSNFIVNPQQSIGELMGGVAIAMVASLFGIILSTLGSWKAKKSKSILETEKNEFYSWIQAELLPVLSGNIENTLQLLQRNLTAFNSSFFSNISRMENALQTMNGSFEDQLQILNTLKELDIHKMAIANVKVLQQLEVSTHSFEEFAAYLSQTTEYLHAVRDLNAKVSECMNNSLAITHLAAYFEEEKDYFEERKSVINQGVVTFDDLLKKSFSALQENADLGFNSFSQFVVEHKNKIESYLQASENAMEQKVCDLSVSMESHINEQVNLLEAKLGELNSIAEAMKNFASLQTNLSNLVDALQTKPSDSYEVVASVDKLGKKLDILCQVVKDSGNSGWQDSDEETKYVSLSILNKPYMRMLLYVLAFVLFLASLGVIFIAGHLIVNLIKL
jgi:hypothetical protein